MTQEEKQLLLKDLCARIQYGVKISTFSHRYGDISMPKGIVGDRCYFNDNPRYDGDCPIEEVKPYLRPMSSMTEEEGQKYYDLTHQEEDDVWGKCLFDKMVDFCNERHLDYRGLIEKGLALEAPEGMYKTE